MSAAFSAIMMVGEFVLPEVIRGITLASTTGRLPTALKRSSATKGTSTSASIRSRHTPGPEARPEYRTKEKHIPA